MTIYDASMRYQEDGTPLVVLAGKEYGSGSSRDWAAKGTLLLGVRAVIAESFERIHRSQPGRHGRAAAAVRRRRVGGVARADRSRRRSRWRESPSADSIPRELTVNADDKEFGVTVRIDTPKEQRYFRHGGILQFVLRQLLER